jgi:hypothetical protein
MEKDKEITILQAALRAMAADLLKVIESGRCELPPWVARDAQAIIDYYTASERLADKYCG